MIEKRLKEIKDRKKEIRSMLEEDKDLNMEEIKEELEKLEAEERQLEKRMSIAKEINTGDISANLIEKPEVRNMKAFEEMDRDEILSTPEYRSAFLKQLQGKTLNEIEKRALTTDPSSAGAAVPTQTLNMIIDKMRQTSALFPRVNVSYVPGNLSLVVANAKNAAQWKPEGADGTAEDDTVVEVNLTGYELIKLVEVSAAAQAMTIDAFEAYISAEIGRQMAIAVENAILNGTGSGQPTGILTGVTWDTTNSLSFTTPLEYDHLVDGLSLLPTMYHQNAVFVMNRSMLFSGVRKIKTTDGQPVFTYNPQDEARNAILGYPVIIDDYAPNDTILLGDFSYYYWNFSQAPQIETSREAAFRSGKVVYRGLAVADGKPALDEAFVKIEVVNE